MEVVVTLAVLSIVMAITSVMIIGFDQSSTNIVETSNGVQQQELASQSLMQYLRGISQVLVATNSSGTQVAPSPDELDAIVAEGFDTSTYSSNCTNLDALSVPPTTPNGDAGFDVTYDVPAKGPANGGAKSPEPWSSVTPSSAVVTAYSPPSTCTPASSTPRTVDTYYSLGNQTAPVFTYYKRSAGGLEPLTIDDPVPACAVSEIVAVGLHITFLAGPQQPRGAGAGVESTTLDTTVYLHAAETASTTTSTSTTSTTSTTACPE